MRVHPTNQEIEIDGNSVTIGGEYTFTYDDVRQIERGGKTYIEGTLNGEIEDRFMIA